MKKSVSAKTAKINASQTQPPLVEANHETTLRDVVSASRDKKLLLNGVSWNFYKRLLKEYENSNGLRFAFDNGILEIEMPTPKHESPSQILSDLITTVCVELEIDVRNLRTTTLRKKPKTKGVEPDVCFYIQNEPKMRGKMELDLTKDPPPDLVVEVDITSPSLDKMPIYAALGVPEVWLYEGESVVFKKLVGGKYKEIKQSLALPALTGEKATEFLNKGLTESSSAWFRQIREWANSLK